ncbi:MAG TPA: MBL fold metallo-hydrolase, partial [Balneolaceae bacterium]|nr:MBL fold metallo-hydrolase [Balneolaceae bacterium]
QQAAAFGVETKAFGFEPKPLKPQQNWQIGAFTFDLFYTPGHAPDHVVLYNQREEFLIAGDTLFKEGIGRTDLYKGDLKQLKKSIKEKIYTLPDNTVVYSGHGPATTIGHEKKANPFIRQS